jgi:hypothetical protein
MNAAQADAAQDGLLPEVAAVGVSETAPPPVLALEPDPTPAPAKVEIQPPDPERIPALDLIRGVAILGVLLANITWFSGTGAASLMDGDPRVEALPDLLVKYFLILFVDAKFITQLAILLHPAFLKTQRKASLQHEGGQDVGLVFEAVKSSPYSIVEFFDIGRTQVAQLAVLRPTPHPFVRVRVRVVGRKILHHDIGMLREPSLDYLGFAMDAVAIPDYRPLPRKLPGQVFQELDHLLPMDVLVDPPPKVEPDVPGLRAERHATDGRDPVVSRRATHDHPPPPTGHCPADQGRHQEARFVQESNVRATSVGLAEDAGEFISLPAFHFLVVALPGSDLRLVAAPV